MNTREACAANMERLYSAERTIQLAFLDELGEFDRRSWYAPYAYSSTWAYLTQKMRMPNGTAFRRIRAARLLLLRLPIVRGYLEAGTITVTKLAMLDDVLEEGNCVELIEKAIESSEQEVRIMVAELQPEGTYRAEVRVTVLTKDLREVKMVVDREWMAAFEQVSHVLSHEIPKGELPDVLLACMNKVIADHHRRTYGVVKPRVKKPAATVAHTTNTRPTVAVRRAVWERDQSRCTFQAADGTRCNSQHQLEEHHIVPAGKGGPRTVDNVTLHCRCHNLLRAREDFGERHMAKFRRQDE